MKSNKQTNGSKERKPINKRYLPTPYANLRKSAATGDYILLCKVGGKRYTYSLDTTDAQKAQDLRDTEIKAIKEGQTKGNDGKGSLTLQQAFDLYLESLKERRELEGKSKDGISEKTDISYRGCVNKLKEYIPSTDFGQPLRKFCLEDLKRWVRPIQKEYSATYYNTSTIILRALWEIGIGKSAVRVNIAKELEHVVPPKKELNLPTQTQWDTLIQNIRDCGEAEASAKKQILRQIIADYKQNVEINYTQAFQDHPEWQKALGLGDGATKKEWHKVYDMVHYIKHEEKDPTRRGMESADMVEFLTYTGARIGETRALDFERVDFERGQITFGRTTVKGKTRTKVVPIHPALLPVLHRCQERAKFRGDKKVFGIKDCRKAIQSACHRLGFPKWTHHDFRHLFASEALMDGAAPIVVAEALGHSDKGRTLLDRYAHVNAERAKGVVVNLQFGKKAAKPAPASQEIAAKLAELEAENKRLREQLVAHAQPKPENVLPLALAQ